MRILYILAAALGCQAVIHPGSGGPATDPNELWVIPVAAQAMPGENPRTKREAYVNVVAPDLSIHKPAASVAEPAAPAEPAQVQAAVAKPAVAAADWTIGELYIENSEATANGFVEYRLRGTLHPLGSSRRSGEISASARSASAEVAVLSGQLHFQVKEGDDLDALSRDAIRIRLRGGLSFEPSMLRWTIQP